MKRSEINTLRQMRAALKSAQASIGKNLHQILDDDGEHTYCLQSLRDINRALLASYSEFGRPGKYVVLVHRCGARGTRTEYLLLGHAECRADARAVARRVLGIGSNVAVVAHPWWAWARDCEARGEGPHPFMVWVENGAAANGSAAAGVLPDGSAAWYHENNLYRG